MPSKSKCLVPFIISFFLLGRTHSFVANVVLRSSCPTVAVARPRVWNTLQHLKVRDCLDSRRQKRHHWLMFSSFKNVSSQSSQHETTTNEGDVVTLTEKDKLNHFQHQREYFDALADIAFEESITGSDKRNPLILAHVSRRLMSDLVQSKGTGNGAGDEDPKPFQILDVGSGAGVLFPPLLSAADTMGVNLNITAVDISLNMCRKAEIYAKVAFDKKSNNQHQIQVINQNFLHLDENYDGAFREYFDCVIFNESIENFLNVHEALEAAVTMINHGGSLIITHSEGMESSTSKRETDPKTFPGQVLSVSQLRDVMQFLPLQITDFIENFELLDESDKLQAYKFYYASARRVPRRALRRILRLRGPVAPGYGRGGKQLGIPTANLPESLFADALADIQPGVYFGWAVIEDPTDEKQGRNVHHKAVVNVGYSPTFEGTENKEKIVEAHLIIGENDVEIKGDFYNETMRLSLIGSLRPEKKFASFPELLAAIRYDIQCARDALLVAPFSHFRTDSFLVEASKMLNGTDVMSEWVGADGGDTSASWEFEDTVQALEKMIQGK